MKFRDEGPIRAQAPMTVHELDGLMLHLLRCPQVFATAHQHLKPEHFSFYSEPHRRVFWEAILNVHATIGYLPTVDDGLALLFSNEVGRLIDSRPDSLTPEQVEDLIRPGTGLVDWCLTVDAAQNINPAGGLSYLRRFLIERVSHSELVRQVESMKHDVSDDLPKILQNVLDQVRRYENLDSNPVESAAPSEEDVDRVQVYSTGVGFLDGLMNGGQARQENYCIIGPTGVGKTLLGSQICIMSAINSQAMAAKDPSLLEHWYFFTYEAPAREIRNRMMACLGKIDVNRVSRMKADQLAILPEKYERERFAEEIQAGKFINERRRYDTALKQMSVNCWVIDMSGGNPKHPSRGEGYVEEIRAILQAEADKGKKIGGYVVDYVAAAARRHALSSASGHSLDHLRHLVAMFPMTSLRLISQPFDCTGWMLNQANTEANRRSAGAVPHHSYASEAGNFAENVWFAFCLGTKDVRHNTCLLNCSKSRRAQSSEPIPLIIDGMFNTMVDGRNKFQLDRSTHEIIQKETYAVTNGARPDATRYNPAQGLKDYGP